jgi:membrane protein required for colicin V production
MSVADYVLIVIVTVSVLIGCLRGFIREGVSLAAWAVAVWVALRYAWLVEPWLGALDPSPSLKLWAARGILFVAALLAGALVNYLLGLLVRSTGLSGTDRLLGMVFGLGRGVLVVGVLVIGGQYIGMNADPWWQQSRLMPWGERLADGLREFADEAGERLKDIDPLGTGMDTTANAS